MPDSLTARAHSAKELRTQLVGKLVKATRRVGPARTEIGIAYRVENNRDGVAVILRRLDGSTATVYDNMRDFTIYQIGE